MYQKNSHQPKAIGAPMSPRISFSNDFAESSRPHHHHHQMMINHERAPPVSSDFEFSVTNDSMTSTADELFFKGRLLPFKGTKTTLRDELLAGDDNDDDNVPARPPKGGSTRWKGFLGLKKSHIGSKKMEKREVHVTEKSQLHAGDVD